ncbi:uncharacterized protein [Argopecten irradians]|uniref:uncharacterized protein n=1 Tax=Argopecten irradians TaxID=31199 RepID=UPI0037230E93
MTQMREENTVLLLGEEQFNDPEFRLKRNIISILKLTVTWIKTYMLLSCVRDSLPTLATTRRQISFRSSGTSATVTEHASEDRSGESSSSPLSAPEMQTTYGTSTSDDQDESDGPVGIESYGAVKALENYLVALTNQMTALTRQQATTIVLLWGGFISLTRSSFTFPYCHRTN